MRFEGRIKTWDDPRGFGFIEPTLGGQDVFVHVKAFARSSGRPLVGQRVSFEVELGPQGKKRARKVQQLRPALAGARASSRSPTQWGGATLFAIPIFLVLYVVVDVFWRPPGWFALVYLLASVCTFFAYAADKASAQRGGQRVSEKGLHTLSLAGGWPGALLAQQFLRHKSAKAAFRSVFWATVIVNVLAFVLLSSPAVGDAFASVTASLVSPARAR